MANFVFPALFLALFQVILSIGTVESGPAGTTQFVSITDSVYLTYASVDQRSVFLQQVRVIWQNVLQEGWGVTNVEIAFLSEQNAQQNAVAANSPTRHRISYKISGNSFQTVDVNAAKTQFKAALDESGLVGVQEISADDGSSDNSGSAVANKGQGQQSSSGAKSFRITDYIILSYTSSKQRDTFLSQVMVMWRNSLNVYQATNVKITFISESAVPQASSANVHVVKYQITGKSVMLVDIQKTMTEVRQTVEDAHLSGMTTTAGLLPSTADATNSNDVDNSGDDANQDSTADQTQIATSGDAIMQFQTTDSVILTYTSTQQRDSLLQQILTIWKTALSQYQASNVMISFVSEKASSGSSKQVTYKITAQSTQQIDTQTVKTAVHQSIQSAHITGIQSLTKQQQQTFDSSSDNIDNQGSAAGQNSKSQVQSSGQQQQFQTTDSIILTYSNTQQRDTLLQQILVMWRNALSQYQASNVMISFVSEKASSGSSKQVTYKIIAQSSQQINTKTVKNTVHQAVQSAHLTGVQMLTTQQQQTFDSSKDNIDNQVSGSSAQETSQSSDVANANQDSNQSSNQDSNQDSNQSSNQSSDNQDQNSGSSSTTNNNSGSQSTSGQSSGQQQFQTTDAAILTYTTTQQRDSLLQQILAQWKTALSQYQASNIMISFVSEKASSGSSKQVTYKITAQSSQQVDTKTIKTKVHQSIQTAHTTGITLLNTQQQTTFDSSSENIDNQASTSQDLNSQSTDNQDQDSSSSSSGSGSSGSQSTNNQNSNQQQFQTTDSAILTYTNSQQRDNLLQQILSKWTSALSQYQASNVKITFVSEKSSSSSSKQVTYKITANTQVSSDASKIKSLVHQSIQSAKISGVQSLSTQQQQTFDSSSDNTDISTNKVADNSGSKNFGLGLAPGVGTGMGMGMGLISGNVHQKGSASQSENQLQLTDSLILTYTSTQQRDDLLQQILTVWSNSLGSANVGDLKISFVKEQPSTTSKSQGAKEVTYTISGKTGEMVNAEQIKSTVHQSLQTSKIWGVEVGSSTASDSTVSQSQNNQDWSVDSQTSKDKDQGSNANAGKKQVQTPTATGGKWSQKQSQQSSWSKNSSLEQQSQWSKNSSSSSKLALNARSGPGMVTEALPAASPNSQTIADLLSLAQSSTIDQEQAVAWMKQLWAAVKGLNAEKVVAKFSGNGICLN